MKQFFRLLVVTLMLVLNFSCQKEENIVLNDDKYILDQLAKISVPTEEEFRVELSKQKILKSASDAAPVSVKIFNLLEYTYQISSDKAVKTSLCMEVNSSGYFSRVFTLYQTFAIVNGKIDETQYNLRIQVACPFSKVIKVKDELNTNYFWYWAHIHMANGEEFGYFDPNQVFTETHQLEIYPIKGVTWEIQVGANVQYGLGKNRYEILSVPMIAEDMFIKNKDSQSDIEVSVNFNIGKESNLYLEIPKDHPLWDTWADYWIESIFLYGESDENLRLEVSSNGFGDSSKRIFPIPFKLTQIQVAYRGENLYSSQSYTKSFSIKIGHTEDGKTYYIIGDQF